MIAPKIGIEGGLLLCFRFSIADYIHHGSHDFRFIPEVGFDLMAYGNICYGWNTYIAGNKYTNISPHRLSWNINIDFWKLLDR